MKKITVHKTAAVKLTSVAQAFYISLICKVN